MPEDRYEILKYPGHHQEPIVWRYVRGQNAASDMVDSFNDKRTSEEMEAGVRYEFRVDRDLIPKPKTKASKPRDKRLTDDRHPRR